MERASRPSNCISYCGSMAEQLIRNEQVVSSILTSSSKEKDTTLSCPSLWVWHRPAALRLSEVPCAAEAGFACVKRLRQRPKLLVRRKSVTSMRGPGWTVHLFHQRQTPGLPKAGPVFGAAPSDGGGQAAGRSLAALCGASLPCPSRRLVSARTGRPTAHKKPPRLRGGNGPNGFQVNVKKNLDNHRKISSGEGWDR